MIELTEEQRQELAGAEPVVVDPQTHEEYVLVRKKVYEKLKSLLDDDARLMYPMLADLDPEDWEDAAIYDNTPEGIAAWLKWYNSLEPLVFTPEEEADTEAWLKKMNDYSFATMDKGIEDLFR